MKKQLYILIIFMGISGLLFAQEPNISGINLKVSNVCDNLGQIIGINHSGGSASIGNGGCVYASVYTHFDSVQIGGPISFMNTDGSNFWQNQPKPLCVGNSNMVITYYNTFPTWGCNATTGAGDTLMLDSIVVCIPKNGYLYVIRNSNQTPNFLIFQAPSSTPLFTATLNMTPQKLSVGYQNVVIIGIGQNNEPRLNIFNLQFGIAIKDTAMSMTAAEPRELISSSNGFHLISSPGDSIITFTKYNINTQQLSTTIIHPSSGLNTGTFYYEYYDYQPLNDTTGNNYNLKIRRYNTNTMLHESTFNIGKHLRVLRHAAQESFSYYPFIHAVTDSIPMCGVWVYDAFNYSLADSFVTPSPPDFILTDLRCPTGVEEYDDHLVKILAYPNPTSGILNINASGLICGRDYKMDITDINGKIIFEKTIRAKTTVEIPFDHFPAGVYLLRIHTRKGVVSERVVKT